MFIAHPGVSHGTGPLPNPENQHLWMGLRLSDLGTRGAFLAGQIRRRKVLLLRGFHEAELLIRAIIGQVVTIQPQRASVIQSLLSAFIETVNQRIIAVSPSEKGQKSVAWPYSFMIQKVVAYMQRNLDRRISLKDLAGLASTRNAAHFCTLFRQEVGLTPAAYHVHLRLHAAREALRQPTAEITTIAHQFGFSSSQHFSTQFHRLFGTTPLQWKKGKPSLRDRLR
jgi:AraC-like DNA-binding protein